MRDELLAATWASGGVITRDEALAAAPHHVLDRAIGGGALVRTHPQVFVLRALKQDPLALDRAALAYASTGALSHTSALRLWALPCDARDGRRHVTTGPRPHLRGNRSLVVHRRQGFSLGQPQTATRDGLRVVTLEQAVVESWPLIRPASRRAPAIAAVNEGRTTPHRLLDTLHAQAGTHGAAQMGALFALLEDGCRSELELWGHRHVFDDYSLPAARLQYRVVTPIGVFYLDRAYLEERVGVETDGAAWHGRPGQREHDVRRDAALAATGWLVVRFTHARLHSDPIGCRNELRRILQVRRSALIGA